MVRLLRFLIFLWPILVWWLAREYAGTIAAGTTWYRTAMTAAPALLGVAALVLGAAQVLPWISTLMFIVGSVVAGVMGLTWEYQRWSLAAGYSYDATTILAHLDYPLVLVSLVALLVPVAPLVGIPSVGRWFRRGLKSSTVHGSATWLTVREAARLFRDGKLIFGEAYDPEHRLPPPGTAPLLRISEGEHLLTVGGAGTGKTTSIAMPNCLSWPGALVALDPKGELARDCRRARESMGRTVLVLDPSSPNSDAINVLDWLDPSSDHVVSHVTAVTTWLTGGKQPEGQNAVFEHDARELVEALLLDLICDPSVPPPNKTLREAFFRLSGGGIVRHLEQIERKPQQHAFGAPQSVAARFVTMAVAHPPQWEGVLAYANALMNWLKQPPLARLVSGEGKRVEPVSKLIDGNLDVFVAVPLRTLDADPAVARVLLGALLNAVYARFEETKQVQTRVLFLLDEMARLRKMDIVQTARDAGRGLGVTLWAIVQDLGQLDQCYGQDGARGWIESTRLMNFLGVRHPQTAEFVSAALGQETRTAATINSNAGTSTNLGTLWGQRSAGHGTSQSYVGRALMTPGEVMQMRVDDKGISDEQIVFIRGYKPLRCGLAKFYRRPEMKNCVP